MRAPFQRKLSIAKIQNDRDDDIDLHTATSVDVIVSFVIPLLTHTLIHSYIVNDNE